MNAEVPEVDITAIRRRAVAIRARERQRTRAQFLGIAVVLVLAGGVGINSMVSSRTPDIAVGADVAADSVTAPVVDPTDPPAVPTPSARPDQRSQPDTVGCHRPDSRPDETLLAVVTLEDGEDGLTACRDEYAAGALGSGSAAGHTICTNPNGATEVFLNTVECTDFGLSRP